MKKATSQIVMLFPHLKNPILEQDQDSAASADQFNDIESTFLQLARFFENPTRESFDLMLLYRHLKDGWLELALEYTAQFFKEDTFLIQHPTLAIVKESDNYLSQSQFAAFLTERGLKYDRAKVKNYYDRGKIPVPDLIVAGVKYWSTSSAESYCEQELRRMKMT
ncbi:hypothetical protein J7I93_09135 [Bacillus sp. ISL-47]|uniref:hypothetical protein n=1 Tax=Bacillus sp. ISL-47 TaxID=2819130 RepID=UPI001BECD886|nr:hypothetical protein [Bacillus sp. ISL-47]MBT2688344.1 hypothetical protein [Bacillus sp. ISL-47]MBT2710545.1 hypothetical protein [Pseudomonas sp. ISL-84]